MKPEQHCTRCLKPVKYNPRYPKYICRDCASLEVRDENGFLLKFYNVSLSGGLRVQTFDGSTLIDDDSSLVSKPCFIDGEAYIATEARFGGIVIQKK